MTPEGKKILRTQPSFGFPVELRAAMERPR